LGTITVPRVSIVEPSSGCSAVSPHRMTAPLGQLLQNTCHFGEHVRGEVLQTVRDLVVPGLGTVHAKTPFVGVQQTHPPCEVAHDLRIGDSMIGQPPAGADEQTFDLAAGARAVVDTDADRRLLDEFAVAPLA